MQVAGRCAGRGHRSGEPACATSPDIELRGAHAFRRSTQRPFCAGPFVEPRAALRAGARPEGRGPRHTAGSASKPATPLTAPVVDRFPPGPLQRELLAEADARPWAIRHVEQFTWEWYGPLDHDRFSPPPGSPSSTRKARRLHPGVRAADPDPRALSPASPSSRTAPSAGPYCWRRTAAEASTRAVRGRRPPRCRRRRPVRFVRPRPAPRCRRLPAGHGAAAVRTPTPRGRIHRRRTPPRPAARRRAAAGGAPPRTARSRERGLGPPPLRLHPAHHPGAGTVCLVPAPGCRAPSASASPAGTRGRSHWCFSVRERTRPRTT